MQAASSTRFTRWMFSEVGMMKTYIVIFRERGKNIKKQFLAHDMNSAMDYALTLETKRMVFVSVVLQP